jgi:hypothetical protein
MVLVALDHRHERFRMTSLIQRTSITTVDIGTNYYAIDIVTRYVSQ